MTPRRSLAACGVSATLVLAACSLFRPLLLTRLERTAYDVVLRASPAFPPGGRVVIVDVDEKSLAAIGQWPWRRDRIAALVSRLRDQGAAMIALDVIFAERDRDDGGGLSPDAALAGALTGGRTVLGYGMTFESAGSPACLHHPLPLVIVRPPDEDRSGDPVFHATGAVCSLPMLAEAAGASGFLNAAPDGDGLLRRAPLLIAMGDRVYPSIGLAAVSALEGLGEPTLRVENDTASALTLSDGAARRVVPLDGKGNLLLRYRGPKRTFAYVSAADVLGGRAPDDAIAGRLVLVGTTALGTREVVSTPLDTLFTGVEVQATIADNLLQQDYLRRPGNAVAIETLFVLALGISVTALGVRAGIAWGSAGALAALAGVWLGAIALLAGTGTVLSPLFPSLGVMATLASLVVAGFATERRRALQAGRAQAASQRLMVQTLLSLTEIRDAETGQHSRRTQAYTRILAQELARDPAYRAYPTPERIDLVATLAPLHDIGKVGVPDRVLNKPGALTAEELAEMRRHPVHGRDVIIRAQRDAGVRDDLTLMIAKDIVYTHHEKWDGSGYPEGLCGATIPIPGRIMAVVDVYDASTTRRLYTASLSQDDAAALIVRGRGTHFDPAVVDAFLRVLPELRRLQDGHGEPDLSRAS